MLISEMEAFLKSLDRRVEGLDRRVLPTLATKDELRDDDAGSAGMNRRFDDLEGQLAKVLSRLERR